MATLLLLLPAWVAGMLVLSIHVPLGRQVLQRQIIFIDLAVAQIAACGLLLAQQWQLDTFWQLQGIAVLFALSAAAVISVLARFCQHELEALIGCLYVLAATGALLLVAHDPHGLEVLKKSLDGEILWVQWGDVLRYGAVVILCAVLMCCAARWLQGAGFYFVFAIAITSTVQLVGVYLVFASLIIPILAARPAKAALWWGYGIGMLGLTSGMFVSFWLDWPTSAAVVWCLAGVGLLFRLIILRPQSRLN